MKLHRRLLEPLRGRRGDYVRDLLLDLVVYFDVFDVAQLDLLVQWYRASCPQDRFTHYIIEENTTWDSVMRPLLLTNQGKAAALAGASMPYVAPVRTRVATGRRYYLQFWDGRPTASWSLCIRAMHLQDSGLHGFARLMVPLDTDVELLHQAALAWADHLSVASGHGGLCFAYHPWHLGEAFDSIYGLARRFWGIDVEHLNGTLPLVKERVKGVSWLTLVGQRFRDMPDVRAGLDGLRARADLQLDDRARATVVRIGREPLELDQNRPDGAIAPYQALATALEPVYLDDHPDFPGDAFQRAGNSLGWIRRFIEPGDWL